jgi:hypothetical protein
MPSIDIDNVMFDDNEMVATVTYNNDTNQGAELSGSLGGSGFNQQFSAVDVPPNTSETIEFNVAIPDDLFGADLLFTVSLSERGQNTGDYPGVDEQRNVTVDSTGGSISEPIFGGGGTVDSGNNNQQDGGGLLSGVNTTAVLGLGALGVGAVVAARNRNR